MVGNEGNVSDFFSNKNVKNDTLFLNEWLLFKDEHKLRPPKTIQNGTYKQNNSFKSLYGKKILEKLHSFGFSNNLQ